MEPLGWQKMLEAKGVQWPQGALHLRPLDIDPDAVRNITQHWDISAIAAPEVVDAIAAQTAGESLASWGMLDPTPAPRAPPDRLDTLSVPTLVLWGSEDAGLNKASQERLIEVLQRASSTQQGNVLLLEAIRRAAAAGIRRQASGGRHRPQLVMGGAAPAGGGHRQLHPHGSSDARSLPNRRARRHSQDHRRTRQGGHRVIEALTLRCGNFRSHGARW